MTAQTQPEALRLADCFYLYATGDEYQRDAEAAVIELRRLHAENESQAARIAQLEAALAGAEPVSGQCRFAGEKSWGWCAVEHVRMVQADPRYAAEGYEARYLYTHPPASRQPLSDEQIDALPIVIHLRQRIKHWKRESAKRYVEGWNDSAEQEGARSAPAAPVELPEPAFRLSWRPTRGVYVVDQPGIESTDCYTPEQVRELLAAAPKLPQVDGCWCQTCRPITLDDMRMVLCPECGNKRCPRATHHDNACTGSNEPGQPGSSWRREQQPQEQSTKGER